MAQSVLKLRQGRDFRRVYFAAGEIFQNDFSRLRGAIAIGFNDFQLKDNVALELFPLALVRTPYHIARFAGLESCIPSLFGGLMVTQSDAIDRGVI